MEKKLILVTGGAGYVGSVLVKKLIDKNYRVRILDRLFFGDEHIKDLIKDGNELIKLDIRDIENHQEVLKDVYAVMHLADISNDPSCELNEEHTIENNIIGGKKLIETCKKNSIKRFIYSSSCSVYGARGDEYITEESPRSPVSLYAKSKVEVENFLLGMQDDKFIVTILRHGTIFGYSPRMRFDLIVNTMTKYATTQGKITIKGSNSWRPNVYVGDVADAFIRALEAPEKDVNKQIFNVGSKEMNYTVKDVANIVASIIPNTRLEYSEIDIDPRSYRVNFDKIEKVLGFKAKTTIEESVKEIIQKIKEGKIDPNNKKHITLEVIKELDSLPKKEGGLVTRYKFLPLSVPFIGNEEIREITDALISGWLTRGPKTALLEEEFKKYCKVKYAHAVSSCTAALHLALIAFGVKAGDEVIVPPVTFSATANVVIHQGATPIFVDVNKETLNIDPDKIEEKITPKTKAIITVDLAGQPCDYDKIKNIAIKHNLKIIEDAAHSVGAKYWEDMVGNICDITCFSFYPTKNMTAAEGGMILTNDEEVYETAKIYSLHGMNRDAWKRYSKEGSPHWDTLVPGYKYNMTDIQSAIGIHQLKRLDNAIAKREAISKTYDEAFKDLPGIILPKKINNIKHAHHLYIIMVDTDKLKINRDEFIDYLREENIGSGIHFISLHRHTYYKNRFKLEDKDLPNASYISDRIISLPFYPTMTQKDVQDVIKAAKKIVNYTKKTSF